MLLTKQKIVVDDDEVYVLIEEDMGNDISKVTKNLIMTKEAFIECFKKWIVEGIK